MLIKIKKDNDNKEYAVCHKNEAARFIPYCRKKCNSFKGYKTTENGQRNVMCEYKK